MHYVALQDSTSDQPWFFLLLAIKKHDASTMQQIKLFWKYVSATKFSIFLTWSTVCVIFSERQENMMVIFEQNLYLIEESLQSRQLKAWMSKLNYKMLFKKTVVTAFSPLLPIPDEAMNNVIIMKNVICPHRKFSVKANL